MGNMQLAYLAKERAYSSDSGVIYLDLPSAEQISMIMIEFSVGSGASSSVVGSRSVLDTVKDVQVLLEGAKTAYKCAPEVGSFLAFLGRGEVPPHKLSNRGTQILRLPILFGRWPFDTEYMLDTSKYANAQLQIEYELNTTYEATGTATLTCYFFRPLTSMSPHGFIRSRTVNLYNTSGSAETKEIDLPTGLPWYRVGFRAYDFDQFIHKVCTDIDFDIDEGRQHLFNGRMEDLITLQKLWFGSEIPMNHSRQMAQNDDWLPTFSGAENMVVMMDESANAVVTSNPANYGPSFQLKWPGVSSEETITTQAIGVLPFSSLLLGNFDEMPFNAPAHSDAKITFELGAYSAVLETFVQEVVEGVL